MSKKKATPEVKFTEGAPLATEPVYPELRIEPEAGVSGEAEPTAPQRSRRSRSPRKRAEAPKPPAGTVEDTKPLETPDAAAVPSDPVLCEAPPEPEALVEESKHARREDSRPRPTRQVSEAASPCSKGEDKSLSRPETQEAPSPIGEPVQSGAAAQSGTAVQKPATDGSHDLAPISFEQLPEIIRSAVERAKWHRLMPVQAQAIPYVLAGRDLMVQSQTGSGKTGAFLLPMLQRLDPSKAVCQALVLVPTRELAVQVADQAEAITQGTGFRSVAVYGGTGYGAQMEAFKKGAHIVIGTPGRILDHLMKHSLVLDSLRMLVFDEADRMLSMGFYPDMKQVKRYISERPLNSYMFSATYPPHVMRLASEFLRNPEFLSLSRDNVHVAETLHVYYNVPVMDKDRALIRIIEIENPESAIIFCNTKAKVHYVTVVLQRFGYDADELSADLPQAEREKVLKRVREGTLRFLVATDVAARGLDIPMLSHVFLYEPPEDAESYIHRAGRTGRAGAAGQAVSLVAGMEQIELQRIARRFHIDLQKRPEPKDADVAALVGERIVSMLEGRMRSRDRLHEERSHRFIELAHSLAQSEDGLPVLAMLLDEFYQATLHAPPVPAEEVKKAGPDGSSASGQDRSSGRRRNRRWRR